MTQIAHTERAHAKLSPSASHRWMECPGSIRMSDGIASTSSAFADEGTAAHELCAHCMTNGYNADRFAGHFVDIEAKTPGAMFLAGKPDKDRVFEVDDEMVDGVQEYLDYLRRLYAPGDEIDIEFRFDLQHVAPGMFGTGDCVIYKMKTGDLIVVDFKYGRGVPVEPENNPQLLAYGLGAMARHGNRPLSNITLSVVQPRCRHSKGSVREWTTGALDLMDFEADLRAAAAATEKPDAPLKAGDWCRFCPAAAVCPALSSKAAEIAGLEFASEGVAPNTMSLDELSEALEKVDVVETWAKRVRAYAHDQAIAGHTVPGWKLVEKRATRKWIDEGEVETTLKIKYDLSEDEIYEREMKSPAELEKLMPGKNKEARAKVLAPFVTKQSSGVVLVPVTDKRPPIKSDGSEFSE